jgi:hypothetical protein
MPRAMRKIAALLYSTPDKKSIDYQKMAADMNISAARLCQIIDRHAVKPGTVATHTDIDPDRDNTILIQLPRKLS